jgi:hypothetical protein
MQPVGHDKHSALRRTGAKAASLIEIAGDKPGEDAVSFAPVTLFFA